VDDDAAIAEGLDYARATVWARDLVNMPSATKTPAWLGAQAEAELEPLGVRVSVRDDAWLREFGFGGVLAVGGAAAAPPRLIEASWQPRGTRGGAHVVLVGKGITFDTGGLQIKRADGMKTMKTDMAGGAAVLAAVRILASRRVPVRVTALVPAAENSFGAASYRPGDVVRHVGGRTSEIANTDAEGRIVLADALAWAVARLRPTALVDVATLTGAMKVALGLRTAGLFATDDALADGLLRAAAATGEPLWRMPLADDYESTLDSAVADANNAPGNPGAITAALFLRHFAGRVPWAHLDIAGPARAPKDDGLVTQGGTGFGARLLAEWVSSLA
jgi:leucyl aminopeptidase